MLIGEYQHNIDAKGRVIVPARFREDLGERFYVTKGLDHCLFVLPPTEWTKLQEKIMAMPMGKARGIQRFFFSGAGLMAAICSSPSFFAVADRQYLAMLVEPVFRPVTWKF